jgi:uncharacterized protein (TIGR02246 family)
MNADLQRLVDEDAIRRLTSIYSDAVTHLDARCAASIYADDGSIAVAGNEIFGRAQIEVGMRETFSAFALLQIVAHSGLITVTGDTAQARWSTLELAVRKGADQCNIIFGRYQDSLVRLSEGWRFARREFTMAGRTQIETTKVQTVPEFFRASLG